MAKQKTVFECSACGFSQPKWLGKCPECGEWNTFIEISPQAVSAGTKRQRAVPKTERIGSLETDREERIPTGIREFDRILGGGFNRSSAVIIGGEPGIGKSTLLLHLTASLPADIRVLYVSGEESSKQIKTRAGRIGGVRDTTLLLHATDINEILHAVEKEKPDILFIDSIQTLISAELGAVPGTVNQIKYCSYELITWARENRGAVVFVAHVTKEGSIAGPKVIEHMVDTVLYFEYGAADLRIIRAMKNRFGSTQEIGLFTMEQRGLIEVDDPSRFLLNDRNNGTPPGVAVAAVYEGSRVLLVEIQALTVPGQGSMSRVFSEGIDRNKVSRLAAVCEKHLRLRFSDQDIYINIGGGLRISEVGIDLPLAMALYSARTDLAIPPDTAICGEVSLAGEIRKIPHIDRRMKTAGEIGFNTFISPLFSRGGGEREKKSAWRQVSTIQQAVNSIFSKERDGTVQRRTGT